MLCNYGAITLKRNWLISGFSGEDTRVSFESNCGNRLLGGVDAAAKMGILVAEKPAGAF